MEYGSPRLEARAAVAALIALVIGGVWTYQTYGPRRAAFVVGAFGFGVLLATLGESREAVAAGALLFLGTIVLVCAAFVRRRQVAERLAGKSSDPSSDQSDVTARR